MQDDVKAVELLADDGYTGRAKQILAAVDWEMDNHLPRKGEGYRQCERRRLIETMAVAFAEDRLAIAALQQRCERLEEAAHAALPWVTGEEEATALERALES